MINVTPSVPYYTLTKFSDIRYSCNNKYVKNVLLFHNIHTVNDIIKEKKQF